MTVTALPTTPAEPVPHDPSISRWRCHCPRDRKMRANYWRMHRKLTDRGRNPIRTDVQDAVQAINAWTAYGYTLHSIGGAIGMTPIQLGRIRAGETRFIDRRVLADLQQLTHARLIDATPDTKWVPSVGALRRLQALAWRGWSSYSLPLPNSLVQQMLRNTPEYCTARGHRQIAAAFREFEMLEAPGGSADRVRQRARAQGWLSPLAWDTETIDDPEAEPWGDSPAKLDARRAAFIENVDFLITAMVPVPEVVRRLAEFEPDGKLRLDQAEQRLRRAGNRGDARARELARLFNLELARSRRLADDAHAAS